MIQSNSIKQCLDILNRKLFSITLDFENDSPLNKFQRLVKHGDLDWSIGHEDVTCQLVNTLGKNPQRYHHNHHQFSSSPYLSSSASFYPNNSGPDGLSDWVRSDRSNSVTNTDVANDQSQMFCLADRIIEVGLGFCFLFEIIIIGFFSVFDLFILEAIELIF